MANTPTCTTFGCLVSFKKFGLLVSTRIYQSLEDFYVVRTMSDQYPVFAYARVIKGPGYGTRRRFGNPTASIPYGALTKPLENGAHFAYASVDNGPVYKAQVWTRQYEQHPLAAKMRARKFMPDPVVEVYILHKFESDFHGKLLRLCILGGIERIVLTTNVSFGGLLEALKNQFARTERILDDPQYQIYKEHRFFHPSSL